MSKQVFRASGNNNDNNDGIEVTFSKPVIKDMDSVLDQIDAVLEKNAEEFVKGFIQKGGQ